MGQSRSQSSLQIRGLTPSVLMTSSKIFIWRTYPPSVSPGPRAQLGALSSPMDAFLVKVQLGFVLEGGPETINPKPVCTKKKKCLLSDLLKHTDNTFVLQTNLPKGFISRNTARKSSVNPYSYVDFTILIQSNCFQIWTILFRLVVFSPF